MPPDPLHQQAEALAKQIEDKFFVAGQMDAQGHEAEKWKIGSGGAVLALSKRLLSQARADLAALQQRVQAETREEDARIADSHASVFCAQHEAEAVAAAIRGRKDRP